LAGIGVAVDALRGLACRRGRGEGDSSTGEGARGRLLERDFRGARDSATHLADSRRHGLSSRLRPQNRWLRDGAYGGATRSGGGVHSAGWAQSGGNLAALQLALGHSSILVTQRYARLTDEHVRAEANRLVETR